MSSVSIDYSEIYSAAKKAKSVSGYYDDFADEVSRNVSHKLTSLTGSDKYGNVGNARGIVSRKIRELKDKKAQYYDLAANIERLATSIEAHENNVVSGVRRIATEALELRNRSTWEAFSQWVYGTFCVDLVNSNPITRGIGNGIKRGLDWVREQGTKVKNWFKYGEGKYCIGIFFNVLAVAGSIVGTFQAVMVAIAATIATGGLAAPLIIAAVASTISTILLIGDASFSIANKIDALKIQSDTNDPGRARYYGNINSVNDAISKTDMGGASENAFWAEFGKGYDILHTAADITSIGSGMVGKSGLYGKISKESGKLTLKTTYDSSNIRTTLTNTFKEKLGFTKKGEGWSFNIKNLISTKKGTGTIERTNVYVRNVVNKHYGKHTYETLDNIKKVVGYPSRLYNKMGKIEDVFSKNTSIYDKIESGLSYIGSTPYRISSIVSDYNNTIGRIIKTARSLKW